MLEKRPWKEFKDTGLLWFINRTLHLFGWAIVLDVETVGEELIVKSAYPARCKFRGFDMDSEGKGFITLTEYLKNNSSELLDEAKL